MEIFPIARLQRAGSGAVGREKCGGEVAVFYSGEIFSALPDAGRPVIEAVEFFVGEIGDFPVFGVVGGDGFDGRGIGDGEIAESAEPGEADADRFAVELGGGVDVHNVTVLETEALGDFEVAVAPGKFDRGRTRLGDEIIGAAAGSTRACLNSGWNGLLIEAVVGGFLEFGV